MRHIFLSITIWLIGLHGFIYANDKPVTFEYAYQNEELWPAFVEPNQEILDNSGKMLLSANIRVVLIRAYENGELLVVDRIGAVLIEHSKTNFLELIAEGKVNPKPGGTKILMNQLARRIFDLSENKTKALSDADLSKYKNFLIIRTSSQLNKLEQTVKLLVGIEGLLAANKTRPILIFDELMPNAEFYTLIAEFGLKLPVAAPIFQKGLAQALYGPNESNERVLLINICGKLIHSYSDLQSCIKFFTD
tara:strand:+ start:346 stop:1092 length:747 start_codon:yes stop_codon:yes gene_type:complete